jgi:hypothetical protein
VLHRHRRPRILLPAGLLALIAVAQACVGSPPPPRRDLFSALEKTVNSESMFEFSTAGRIRYSNGGGLEPSPETEAEFYADGSSRPGKGFRMTVRKRPVLWPDGMRSVAAIESKDISSPGESSGSDGIREGGGSTESWLLLEEIPGAVRVPGQPLWFSGRSGAMDAFGALAYALPPLGSPDTVFARMNSLLSRYRDPQFSGQSEVRGHPVDIYTVSVLSETARPSRDALATLAGDRRPATLAPSPTASPSPSPTSLDGIERVSITDAVWLTAFGSTPASELTAAVESAAYYSLVVRTFVDQIDNRVRRVEVVFGVNSPQRSAQVEASAEYWGYDTIGEFKIPVDTTFVSPEGQDTIRRAGFRVTAPSVLPPGVEFTGLEPRPGTGSCEPLAMSYTGRGRAGHLRLVEVPLECGPSIPPPLSPGSQTGSSPSAATGGTPGSSLATNGRKAFELTDTPFGSRISLRRDGESLVAFRQLEDSWVTLRSDAGISIEDALLALDRMVPLAVPIPKELSLPLPQEGPERR